jgi:hypothetical protein
LALVSAVSRAGSMAIIASPKSKLAHNQGRKTKNEISLMVSYHNRQQMPCFEAIWEGKLLYKITGGIDEN